MNVLLPPLPVLKRGWCQAASVHVAGWVARSCCSHVYCGEPTSQPPAAVQLELSTMTCQLPMSVEENAALPCAPLLLQCAINPKYRQQPAPVVDVVPSWLPIVGK